MFIKYKCTCLIFVHCGSRKIEYKLRLINSFRVIKGGVWGANGHRVAILIKSLLHLRL